MVSTCCAITPLYLTLFHKYFFVMLVHFWKGFLEEPSCGFCWYHNTVVIFYCWHRCFFLRVSQSSVVNAECHRGPTCLCLDPPGTVESPMDQQLQMHFRSLLQSKTQTTHLEKHLSLGSCREENTVTHRRGFSRFDSVYKLRMKLHDNVHYEV